MSDMFIEAKHAHYEGRIAPKRKGSVAKVVVPEKNRDVESESRYEGSASRSQA